MKMTSLAVLGLVSLSISTDPRSVAELFAATLIADVNSADEVRTSQALRPAPSTAHAAGRGPCHDGRVAAIIGGEVWGGTHRVAVELPHAPSLTWHTCCERCAAAGCSAFAFRTQQRLCTLHHGAAATVEKGPNRGHIAAQMPRSASATATTLAAPADCIRSVKDLGCWGEGWPMGTKRLAELSTGWRARSPRVCACMCRLRYGRQWTGIVSLGEERVGACACGVHSSAVPAYARGKLPDKCCSATYDPLRQSLFARGGDAAQRLDPKCAKEQPEGYRRPTAQNHAALRRGGAHAEQGNYWAARLFHVELCGACDSTAHGTCQAEHSAAPQSEWTAFKPCAKQVVDGVDGKASYHVDPFQTCVLREGAQHTVRIGARVPGKGDLFVEGSAGRGETKLECKAPLLFALGARAERRRRLLGASPRPRLDATSLSYALQFRDLPPGTSPAEALRLQRASEQWLCKHAGLLSVPTLSCWVTRAAGETTGGADCTPPPLAEARGIFAEAAACGARGQHTTLAQSVAFARSLRSNLAVDIVANMRNVCPSMDALGRCMAPLLRTQAYPWPDSRANRNAKSGAIAIIIPYRARPSELRKWLWWMLPLLARRGEAPLGVFVANLIAGPLWNKARLNNAAVREVRKLHPAFDCFIFADVDLVVQASLEDLDAGFCRLTCDARYPVHHSTLLRGYSTGYEVPYSQGVFCPTRLGSSCSYPHYHGGQVRTKGVYFL